VRKVTDIFSERQKPVFHNQLVTLAVLELFKADLLVKKTTLYLQNNFCSLQPDCKTSLSD
jgi:hypothetical protein